MSRKKDHQPLSSRELLARISLNENHRPICWLTNRSTIYAAISVLPCGNAIGRWSRPKLRPRRSLLLLDEVDSFLGDRRQAQRTWERTQVNELLQQMEQYPGIFVAATNLMSGIDPAALRRFDFKLHFRALTLEQRLALFAREALGAADASVPAPLARHLERLDGLTPGDFATVCRQRRLLGAPFTPEQFLRRLMAEWQVKGERQAQAA